MNRGFSVIELLIAMMIATIVISGVVIGTAGNAGGFGMSTAVGGKQTVVSDGDINSEALRKAQDLIEEAAAKARTNYASVVETTVPTPPPPYQQIKLSIPTAYVMPCSSAIAGTVSWPGSYGRTFAVAATTTIVNIPQMFALAGDCDTTSPTDWDNPGSLVSTNISGQSAATDIDANNNFVYLTTNPNASSKEDLFIYQFDPVAVTLTPRGSFDDDPIASGGYMAIDVAGNYAYVASASTTAQFEAFDISNPDLPIRVAKRRLAGVTPLSLGGSFPQGWSIFYYSGRVYIATRDTEGPELHVFNVADPNPTNWTEIGNGLELTTSPNDIFVSGDYAYLATSDNNSELCIINISDPTNLSLFRDCEDIVGATNMKYDTASNQNGGGIYVLGGKAYLGLSRDPFDTAAPHDFYVLNVSNVTDVSLLDSADLGISNNTTSEGIVVRGRLAFVALDNPTSGLQIWNVSNSMNILPLSICSALNFSENTTGIDMDNNFVFTSNGSNAEIRVIYDPPSSC